MVDWSSSYRSSCYFRVSYFTTVTELKYEPRGSRDEWNTCILIFQMGCRPLFVYFRLFYIIPIKYKLNEAWIVCLGRQDGRRRQIHWAMAAQPNSCILFKRTYWKAVFFKFQNSKFVFYMKKEDTLERIDSNLNGHACMLRWNIFTFRTTLSLAQPWSSGYGRRHLPWRLWVLIPLLHTNLIIFHKFLLHKFYWC